ncbi:glycosyltransferase family 2 protein [Curtanaerobium respiraculi]|uniref:glycosyltransferase family 2 protein n=1 Tax=Curtanaerobium respiraculi TaxID=2949669 RepID=UPI0024B36A7B|nr:glycosyltransferase family 2 protein [Curtanaerobium respiraculi]
MTEHAPKVSVVMPVYDDERTLRQAIESVQRQTLRDIEIICVDDRSTDGSRAIVDELASRDDRIAVVSHERNRGYGAAMNDGFAAAHGTWLGIVESDDYLRPDMLRRLVACAEAADGTVDVAKSPYIREMRTVEGTERGSGPVAHVQCSYRHRIHPLRQSFTMADAGVEHLLQHHPSIWSALYRRDFIEGKRIRFKEYPGGGWADNEFFYETLLQARGIVYCDEPYYVYREETPQEAAGFLQRNKLLVFDRWQGMMDIVERLGLSSCEPVIRSHVRKGFTYLGTALAANGGGDPEIERAMHRMFDRMPVDAVASDATLPPALKRLFGQRRGCDARASDAAYALHLAGMLAYTLRANGVGYTLGRIRGFK